MWGCYYLIAREKRVKRERSDAARAHVIVGVSHSHADDSRFDGGGSDGTEHTGLEDGRSV
jgi:hypothetical protein